MRSYLFVERLILIFSFISLFLAACTPQPDTAASPTPLLPTATPIPATATAVLPTPDPSSATPTAVPTIIPSPTANMLPDLPVTSPDNAGQLAQVAQFGNGRIDSITWSPDGATFVVGTSNGIHFYDEATLQPLQTIDTTGYLGEMNFSPNGDALVTIGCGSPVCPTTSGDLWHPLPATASMPAFTPDGQTVVFTEQVSEEMWQLVWQDLHTGQIRDTLELPLELFYELKAFSLSSNIVVGMNTFGFGEGDKLYLYDMFSGQLLHTLETIATANFATPAAGDGPPVPTIDPALIVFSPQGNLVAASSYDHVVYVWDVQSGSLLYILEGHTSGIRNMLFNADGRILATSSGDERLVRLWDTTTGQLLQTFSGGWQAAFSPDRQTVAVANHSSVVFYDLETGQPLRSLSGYNPPINSLAFSPDGRTLAAAEDQIITLWDIQSQQLIHTIDGNDLILSLTFSPDGRTLAWGGNLGLTLWDLEMDQPIGNFQENDNQVGKILFSPAGRLLAGVSAGTLWLWDANTLALLFSQSDVIVHHLAFHPTEPLLAIDNILTTATGWQWLVQILELDSLQWAHTLANVGPIVTFTPDGLLLAADGSPSDYSPIGAWDIVTGQIVRQMIAPVSTYNPILSPNGQVLAAYVEDDSGFILVDMRSGKPLFRLEENRLAAFSPDGRHLATVSDDDIIRLWELPGTTP